MLLSAATVVAASKTQPLQYVLSSLLIMAALSGIVISFWPALEVVPLWTVPALWANSVMNSRAVAKLLLRPWRSAENYGIWLMVLGAALAIVVALPLRPPWWWLLLAIGLQLAAVPWLIEKRPATPPPNYLPLWLWLGLSAASAIYARWHATQ